METRSSFIDAASVFMSAELPSRCRREQRRRGSCRRRRGYRPQAEPSGSCRRGLWVEEKILSPSHVSSNCEGGLTTPPRDLTTPPHRLIKPRLLPLHQLPPGVQIAGDSAQTRGRVWWRCVRTGTVGR